MIMIVTGGGSIVIIIVTGGGSINFKLILWRTIVKTHQQLVQHFFLFGLDLSYF